MLDGVTGPEPWRKCWPKSTGFQADPESRLTVVDVGYGGVNIIQVDPASFTFVNGAQLTILPSLFAYHKKGKNQQSGPALDLRATV